MSVVLDTLGFARENKSIDEIIEYPSTTKISMSEIEAPRVVLNVSSPFQVMLMV